MAKPKLIIHEIGSKHSGCGRLYFNGSTFDYTYDDGRCGDIMLAVRFLIEIGFVNKEDVLLFYDCCGESDEGIYHYLNKLIEATEK